ncbi:fasciclin-3 [Stomoxys calcitrans]|uniref:fasciclin-3 n=1 Tax=Stomoxys calcitrans TaxID=35570 RepID=UPI0027E2935D|nr:fasciclin-3 [Stomoxys calcitrans]XP_059219857.1 fasciclin-3 [Stomoxys calcitrans]XP_059219858.1 fasciclin-3 [Stomoxys calcitrans]XP_059219859.1 fasciclin-3 [Stomoxys calcitrans]XP_059219860.1 fasciclin-3 [Stomoxys calcitrans]XP_059219861.1 fasciclin-3 [Stomoxys calcitrans]XP_059219862.1 fasciclin-3 [Stomoxys calcitrans]XP_059219863.1 fasciclin-3 [Stomoxys calcitrans]XP_059219864.1 fasciclin-3 [Stomoxys calcitrans]XP_059219865.1 fasciclin-3 [Stomoxys calcitrans]XP_059219866.1 fasciclin-
MDGIYILLVTLLAIDVHLNHALYLTNLSVPRIIDASQKAKLFCSYGIGNHTLNSVKWYKDGQEFFRYSPLTPPTRNWFPVKGVSIAAGSSHCNQFICEVELEKLNAHSSGSYRCEVSGDAPEFKLIDKTANMTVGVLPKFDPFISGLQHTYRYHDYIQLNCSSEGSNPPATLTWYINNKTATMKAVKPQINEISRTTDGFALYASNLQLLINIDDSRFITKSEVLELKCVADIMGIPSVRRETKVRATILALADISYKQRLESPNSAAHSIHCNRVQLAMWTSKWSVWRLIYALMMMTLANLWPTGCNYRMS